MIEIKIPLTDILNAKIYDDLSIKEYIIGCALQAEYVDSTIYSIMRPNIIASDGYIIVQFFMENFFMENKNV